MLKLIINKINDYIYSKSFVIHFIIYILILIDLITKTLFTDKFYGSAVVSIQYSQNLGSSFSMFANIQNYSMIILLFSFIVLIILLFNQNNFMKKKYLIIAFILFIAGLIGNGYDRFFFGFVRDFISIKYLFIFNLADLYFTMSFVFFLISEASDTKLLKREKLKN